jgi:hypothetical protein
MTGQQQTVQADDVCPGDLVLRDGEWREVGLVEQESRATVTLVLANWPGQRFGYAAVGDLPYESRYINEDYMQPRWNEQVTVYR